MNHNGNNIQKVMDVVNMILWRKIYNHKCLSKTEMIKRFMSWESSLGKLVTCTYNPKTQEAETLGLWVQTQLGYERVWWQIDLHSGILPLNKKKKKRTIRPRS